MGGRGWNEAGRRVGQGFVGGHHMFSMTTPGVKPGLSRPQRDVLTTRRCRRCDQSQAICTLSKMTRRSVCAKGRIHFQFHPNGIEAPRRRMCHMGSGGVAWPKQS